MKIARNMSSKFDSSFIPIYGHMVSGVSPVAGKKTAGLIEKETLKKRISNVEGMYSNYDIKRLSAAKPSFIILRFDIRYSAVRCLSQAIEASNLITKKSCHFGVVSYEVSGFSARVPPS